MDVATGRDANSTLDNEINRLSALISAVETALPAAGDDREALLQLAAFTERRSRAQALIARLTDAAGVCQLLDGELHRTRSALALSHKFFTDRAASGAT